MHFLPPAPRALAAAALGLAVANILHLCALLVRAAVIAEQPLTLPRLVMRLGILSLGPVLLAAGIRGVGRASCAIESGRLLVRQRRKLTEIPLDSISHVRLSRLPVPHPALVFRLQYGRTLPERLEVPDPTHVLEALGDRLPGARSVSAQPLVAFFRARGPLLRHRGRRIALKFVLFPLLPALVVFRAYQYIGFGGPFGEYHLYGAAAYARTLSAHVAAAIALLILYATAWRTLAELCVGVATAAFPRRATLWRRIAEVTCSVAYYGGIPAVLAARFLG